MGALCFLLAIVFMGLGGTQQVAALSYIERWMGEPLEYSYRAALDTVIWNSWVPAATRRQYVRSLLFMTVAFALIGCGIWSFGDLVPAVIFGALTVASAISCWRRYAKYRALLLSSKKEDNR